MAESQLPAGIVRHIDGVGGTLEHHRESVVRAKDCRIDELPAWQILVEGTGGWVTIPAHTSRRVILELPDYTTAYPKLVVSGGRDASIDIQWAESLRLTPDFFNPRKGSRAEIEGKYFVGIGDLYILDGGKRTLQPLYWIAGRYVEISIQTADQALQVEAVSFIERRYPLEMESRFECSDQRLNEIQPILLRGMQMCSNETYMDCPYYEEMMYTGDTRLEALVTYTLMNDDRLPRKALRLFDASRMASGMTQSR